MHNIGVVATFVEFVWMEKLKKNRKVKIEHTVGHLKLKVQSKSGFKHTFTWIYVSNKLIL